VSPEYVALTVCEPAAENAVVSTAVVPFRTTGVPAEALSTRKLTLPPGAVLRPSSGVTVAVNVSLAFSAGALLLAEIVVEVEASPGALVPPPVPDPEPPEPQLVVAASIAAQITAGITFGTRLRCPGSNHIRRQADANAPDKVDHPREPVSRAADGRPSITEAFVVLIVSVEEPLPLTGFCVKLQLAPLGSPEQLNVTAPIKPFVSVTNSNAAEVVLPFVTVR
jgi:hypothetical protein